MPRKGKSICKKIGCSVLIEKSGFCDDHNEQTNKFKILDQQKNPLSKKFYNTSKWTKTSKRFREENPLCERCEAKGITEIAKEVHHEPPLLVLLKRKLNPHDELYLHSLCNQCHAETHAH
jgi:5-methylcytosine-specific restriction protein A